MVEGKIDGHENRASPFAGLFAESEFDRAFVEVFQEENSLQHLLRKIRGFCVRLQGLLPITNEVP